jgi:alanine dehydrogenase
MRIGVPKEIKVKEFRVGAVPASVGEFVAHGHEVLVETGAGAGIGFSDADYEAAGAKIAATAAEIFTAADMILKVKEPQAQECKMLRPGQVLFTYLHLAADMEQTKALLASGAVAVAYETVTDGAGRLPLLAPMSEVAGRMAIQVGATTLQKANGGCGVLLGGVPGVTAGRVVIIGGGVAGTNALRMAIGLGARVTVLDRSIDRLRQLDEEFGSRINTLYATRAAVQESCAQADLVVGAVLVPGAAAPKVLRREDLALMREGSVVVDISIDQGGCFETSRPTTHDDPTYVVDGVVHYCVTNMPGAVPRTSTFALNNAVLPFALELADKGHERALMENRHLRNGLNVFKGKLTNKPVADALGLAFADTVPDLAA